jgi:hypothetical protein
MGNPDGIARRCRLPNERYKGSETFKNIMGFKIFSLSRRV